MTPQELRYSILKLAFSGKLVCQFDGEIIVDRTSFFIEETPFDIPEKWKWNYIGQVCEMYTGDSIAENVKKAKYEGLKEGFDYIGTKDVTFEHTICYDNGVRIPFKNNFKRAYKDCILMCIEGGSAGRKIAILDREVCFGNKLCMFQAESVFNKFLYYYLQSSDFKSIFTDNLSGIIGGVSIKKIKNILIPIPPFEEQRRIVTKIEELLPLVDRYEEAWNKLESLNAFFPNSLQKSVIQFGMEGKLTTRIGSEDVELFIKDCFRFKEKLNEDGVLKGRKAKPLIPVSQEDYPHEIPTHWRWCRLGLVCEIFGRIGFRGYTTSDIVEKGKGAITISPSNLNNDGTTDFSSCTYLSLFKYEESPEIMVFDDDILLVKTGSSYGKSALVTSLPEKATINPQLAILKYVCADKKFLNYALMSMSSQKQFKEFVVGTSIPTFSQEKLANLLIPIPPLEEQKRIVTKIEELLPLCRKLVR